jgi:hypothetical protein
MSGVRTRRPITILLVVAAALTALVAGATQAGAVPTASGATTFTLRLPSGGEAGTAAVIVCQGRSDLLLSSIAGNDYAQGTGTTTCPIPMTNVTAQTTLYVFEPLLNRFEPVSVGNYDSLPGRQTASSKTGEYLCTEMPREYVAATYHFARLNNATASGVSTSRVASC